MAFTKILDIKRGDVGGKEVTLLLCFQVPDPEKLYHGQFSVAWRVAPFLGEDDLHEKIIATYVNQLCVLDPEINTGDIVGTKNWIEMNPGEGPIIIENGSGSSKEFGIGISKDSTAIPLLLFTDIKQEHSLNVKFTPIVEAYVVSGYQEGVLLRGEIESKRPIWTQDIRLLEEEETKLVFKLDSFIGEYVIEPDVVLRH